MLWEFITLLIIRIPPTGLIILIILLSINTFKQAALLWLVFYRRFFMECIKEIQDGYEIILSKRLYEREAIISLAYKYSGRFAISLDSIDSEYVSFSVRKHSNLSEPSRDDIEKILADLLDEQLRLEILRRTKEIRDIIYKKAFEPLKVK